MAFETNPLVSADCVNGCNPYVGWRPYLDITSSSFIEILYLLRLPASVTGDTSSCLLQKIYLVLFLKMLLYMPKPTLASSLLLFLPRVWADCNSFGVDFQEGGTYFQNSLSTEDFTYVSRFEGWYYYQSVGRATDEYNQAVRMDLQEICWSTRTVVNMNAQTPR